MNVLSIILIVCGALFGVFCLSGAIALRTEPKVFKILLICTLVCVGLIIIGIAVNSIKEKEKEKEIEEELSSIMDSIIDEVKREYSYIENITYEYTLKKENDYSCDVYIVYQIESSVDYDEKDLDAVFGPGDMFSIKLDLSVYEYLEKSKVKVESYGEIFVNGKEAVSFDERHNGSSNSGSKTCSVCGESYSSGGTSNMCDRCYKNYKYAADAAGY